MTFPTYAALLRRVAPTLALAVASAVVFAPPALAARLKPSGVTASSEYPPEDGLSYAARMAADGKQATSWVEGEEGSGLGSYLEIDLGGPKTVRAVKVWGGLWYSYEYWTRANRPKELEIRYDDGSKDVFELKDEMKAQEFQLPASKSTAKIQIRVKSIYSGSTWLDTAISEVQVFDGEADDAAPSKAVTASSMAPADADGNYETPNLDDGVVDSMWCEGNKAGDGAGEWLRYEFPSATPVSGFYLVNGIGGSIPVWMKGNRATEMKVEFSDGSSETLAPKNSMMPQTVSFPTRSASWAKVTFTGIAAGKEYNDLCLSEGYFVK